MTLKEMTAELTDNIKLGGTDAPSMARCISLINRAKDEIVTRMELLNRDVFVTRQEYTVAADDASITLPTDFRRAVGLTRTDLSYDVDGVIMDTRERAMWRSYSNNNIPIPGFTTESGGNVPIVYPEGNYLYFARKDGAPTAMTLVLRYAKRVADLAKSDIDDSFDDIPDEWHHLIVALATANALPRASGEHAKWRERFVEMVGLMQRAMTGRMDDRLQTIRRVW
jgi:hypothetical protein